MPVRYTRIPAFFAAVLMAAFAAAEDGPSLVERLGFAPDARLLIINADDYGMNHATNAGTEKALKQGCVTSATIMVPCPWFFEAVAVAKAHPEANLGLHLTLTSEWKHYKWGPVAGRGQVASLVTDQGYFYPDNPEVYLNANIEDAVTEVRAQIDKALDAGIDVTHIDSHMGTLQYAPGYHKRYIEIADEYDLPCRIAGREMMGQFGVEYLIDMADELGVLHCEYLVTEQPGSLEETESYWKKVISELPEGKVSEILIHCGQLTPEMKATTNTAARRTADTEFFSEPETLQWIQEQGIELISYRELRHLQRHGEPMPRIKRYGWE